MANKLAYQRRHPRLHIAVLILTASFCFVALKQDLARKHKDALLLCKPHNLALLKSNQQAELEVRITFLLLKGGGGGLIMCFFGLLTAELSY